MIREINLKQQYRDLNLSLQRLPEAGGSLDINKKRELLYETKKELIYDFVNDEALKNNLVSILTTESHYRRSLGKNNVINLEEFLNTNKSNKEVLISCLNNTINYRILRNSLPYHPHDKNISRIQNKLNSYLEIRDDLFCDNIGLVHDIVNKKFWGLKQFHENDLISEGYSMLLDFIEKYNIHSTSSFAFYVYSYLPSRLREHSKAFYQSIKVTPKNTKELTEDQRYNLARTKRLSDKQLATLMQDEEENGNGLLASIKDEEIRNLNFAMNFLTKRDKEILEAVFFENKTTKELEKIYNISFKTVSFITCKCLSVLNEIMEAKHIILSKTDEEKIKKTLFLLSQNDTSPQRKVLAYHLGILDNKEHTRKECEEKFKNYEGRTNNVLLIAIDLYVKKNEINFKKGLYPSLDPNIFCRKNLIKLSINVESFKNIQKKKEIVNAINSLSNTQKFIIKSIFAFEANRILHLEDLAPFLLEDKKQRGKIAILALDAMQKIKQKSEYAYIQMIEYFEKNYSLKENMKENFENLCVLLNEDEAKIFINALGLFGKNHHNLKIIKTFFSFGDIEFEKHMDSINKKISCVIDDFDLRKYLS